MHSSFLLASFANSSLKRQTITVAMVHTDYLGNGQLAVFPYRNFCFSVQMFLIESFQFLKYHRTDEAFSHTVMATSLGKPRPPFSKISRKRRLFISYNSPHRNVFVLLSHLLRFILWGLKAASNRKDPF